MTKYGSHGCFSNLINLKPAIHGRPVDYTWTVHIGLKALFTIQLWLWKAWTYIYRYHKPDSELSKLISDLSKLTSISLRISEFCIPNLDFPLASKNFPFKFRIFTGLLPVRLSAWFTACPSVYLFVCLPHPFPQKRLLLLIWLFSCNVGTVNPLACSK